MKSTSSYRQRCLLAMVLMLAGLPLGCGFSAPWWHHEWSRLQPRRLTAISASASASAAATPSGPSMHVRGAGGADLFFGSPVEITMEDLTPHLHDAIAKSGVRHGTAVVISRHTTTGITINEWESRLVRDVRNWLLLLAPPDERSVAAVAANGGGGAVREGSSSSSSSSAVRYLHNDIHLRPDSDDERARCVQNGWDVVKDPEALTRWRARNRSTCVEETPTPYGCD